MVTDYATLLPVRDINFKASTLVISKLIMQSDWDLNHSQFQ